MVPYSSEAKEIQELLGVVVSDRGHIMNTDEIYKKYFITDRNVMKGVVDGLDNDMWLVNRNEREQRATGFGLKLALDLLQYANIGNSRIINFTSGPCTLGPG